MTPPISVRLDEDVWATLEAEAKAHGLGIGTLPRQLSADAAGRIERQRIRAESEAVGRSVASSPEVRRFVDSLGRPPVAEL